MKNKPALTGIWVPCDRETGEVETWLARMDKETCELRAADVSRETGGCYEPVRYVPEDAVTRLEGELPQAQAERDILAELLYDCGLCVQILFGEDEEGCQHDPPVSKERCRECWKDYARREV